MASEKSKSGKDLGTPIGIISGFLIIGAGIAIQTVEGISIWEKFNWFLPIKNADAAFIVLGSTIAAAMVAIPFNSIKTIPSVIAITVRSLAFDYLLIIEKMCELATIGRKDGLFALEKHAREIEDPFFSNYLEQATFERDAKKLKSNMDMEMNNISSRHEAGAELFTFMGTYAPAFGMRGSLMGLIIMMNKFQMSGETSSIDFNVAEQFKALLTGMGTALITTFYGVFLANMVFLPIAGKLKRRSENELMLKNIVLEGIISIHGREPPNLIREKLMTFVALSERTDLQQKEQ